MKRSFFVLIFFLTACATATPTSTPQIPTPITSSPTPSITPSATRVPATLTRAPTNTITPTATSFAYKPGAALPTRSSPRTLIDARDLARIKTWVEKYPWARDARAQIIKRADAYPARYLQKYHLTAPDLPPTGGQW